MKKIKKPEEIIQRGVWVTCRECGTEFLEDKSWILEDGIVECPICGNKLGTISEGEVI